STSTVPWWTCSHACSCTWWSSSDSPLGRSITMTRAASSSERSTCGACGSTFSSMRFHISMAPGIPAWAARLPEDRPDQQVDFVAFARFVTSVPTVERFDPTVESEDADGAEIAAWTEVCSDVSEDFSAEVCGANCDLADVISVFASDWTFWSWV